MTEGPALALTRGDPSGIGLEIAFKAWLARSGPRAVEPFFLLADIDHCRRHAKQLSVDATFVESEPADALGRFAEALPVVPIESATHGVPGVPDAADGPGTIEAMERAVALVAAKEASAVVTLPVSKDVLHKAGFAHPGQTEFMGELATRYFGIKANPVMLIWSPLLAVVPATIHVPLSHVPSLLTEDLIVETVHIVARDFERRFGVARPRIALTGLNPHAGENGGMGREEIDVIEPAIARLVAEGLVVTGPHPADTLFHPAARKRYDVVVTMYHDQGLIPAKTLAFDTGVNVTLGLPFVRTSPDHGTAFDIAGRGIADPSSLIAALNLAARLAKADRAA